MEIDGLRRSKLHLYRIIIELDKNLLNSMIRFHENARAIFIYVQEESAIGRGKRLEFREIFTKKESIRSGSKKNPRMKTGLDDSARSPVPNAQFTLAPFLLRRFRPLAQVGPYTHI